jgi:hypothetical protein
MFPTPRYSTIGAERGGGKKSDTYTPTKGSLQYFPIRREGIGGISKITATSSVFLKRYYESAYASRLVTGPRWIFFQKECKDAKTT